MNRKPSRITLAFQYMILAIGSLFAFYPIWFVILASGRGQRLFTLNVAGMFVPLEWNFENYRVMLFEKPFLTWLKNSLFVSSLTTLFALVVVTAAAFAISRFRFKGRGFLLLFMLALQTFPGVLSLGAVSLILAAIGLYGSHWGLIMAYVTGTLVFSTMNLKGFFDTIPIELEEAGMIDGCGPIQSFLLIGLPLARPALAITALFGFLAAWGEYVFASVLVPAPDSMKMLVPGMFSLANSMSVPWGYFAAGFVLIIIPTIIVFLVAQRFLEGGLTLGGVKG